MEEVHEGEEHQAEHDGEVEKGVGAELECGAQ